MTDIRGLDRRALAVTVQIVNQSGGTSLTCRRRAHSGRCGNCSGI